MMPQIDHEAVPAGMIDCHLHHGPDAIERKRTAMELAEAARTTNVGGFVLKSHHANTGGLATQVQQLYPALHVIGAVVLNGAVGGLNPTAVRMAGRFGARVVWMPTTSALNHVTRLAESSTMQDLRAGTEDEGITILDERGSLLPVVDQLLEEILIADMSVATGHLSSEETLKLAEHAHRGGFPMHRFVVTHCDMPFTFLDDDRQRYVAGLGAFLERVLMIYLSYEKLASPDALQPGTLYTGRSFYMPAHLDLAGVLDRIRAAGVESSLLSTDLGQAGNPDPIDGIALGCSLLRDTGFTGEELRRMAVDAPRRFLGVPCC